MVTEQEKRYAAVWAPYYRDDLPIDASLVSDMVATAIAGHRYAQDRAQLLEAVDAGEVDVYAPDADGMRSITVGGVRIVVAHWTSFCSCETLEELLGRPLPGWTRPHLTPATP